MEERRLLLAVALSLLVLAVYQFFLAPPPRPHPSPAAAAPAGASSPAATASAPAPEQAPRASAAPAAARPSPSAAPAVVAVADERERRVEVQGSDLEVAFANKGARLVSWRLVHYHDARGRPEDMAVGGRGLRSLDLETGDPDVDARLQEALFRPSVEQLVLREGAPNELVFEWAQGDIEARKVFRFPAKGYLVEVEAEVRRGGRALPVTTVWGPGVGTPSPEEMEVQGYVAPQGVYLAAGKVHRVPVAEIGGRRPLPGAQWAGVEARYFVAMLVPPAPDLTPELRTAAVAGGEPGKTSLGVMAAIGLASAEGPAHLYVGPKDYQVLSRVDHQLARVVDVGDWIGPIVVPLMKLLRWAYSVTLNYGWAIVLLTVMINLAMAPFRHYSIANGLRMAKLAPEMRTIQERYRKVPLLDPKRQEMQQEIADLYARHGMSMGTQMAVGCVPILLTMPFLIAFYRVLQVSIELRGASFLWIPDLSHKDPYFITPVLMGLSMFLMQKMVPTTMDPAQQRMMMVMPLVLSGMFLWAPAGLNLYWLASNVCSIIQQGVTLQLLKDREAPAGRNKGRRSA
jgi:YidC/Oxa1 family membrane protein insertase